ncbi:PREDICTED: transcription elongation factor B polypeptide 3 isoform X1 [Rhagoletis zephyria]|uniref:transcription elongation factor B polypeptide 3 isoform X1 n=1 Tax=Rhagoletis zephyria TaxID=28612 RepID=UPI0008116F2F|nr:PREDICTED: transcription elongation factor B polypeptide 3 isoform X1 [Rhagoletis zephyria]XP_017474274.1 PREDICTED: transcription elongation factor B polypeptide 3 isoform X1 [Rhagoletis zephyria]XP_017474275.1 PREDICTED: transcription elongation factor B polypeptide 3 isoform X1 [Rhagoletis zephyria]
MSSASILSVIQHYQRSIEHSQDDEGRLLHCINKLYRLPVRVEHLQETGVGKTVNSLRKYNGEIGVAAKALVTKWKAMVAAEEEPPEANNCQGDDDDDGNNANGHGSSDDDPYNQNHTQGKGTSQEQHQKNTLSQNTSKEEQSMHKNKSSSDYRSKSHNEDKSNKSSYEQSSSKQKRRIEQEEKEIYSEKKSKHSERDNEVKNLENDKHKSSKEKSERSRERSEKQSSSRDVKTTSPEMSHHKSGADSKEKKDSARGENQNEYTSSSKQQLNHASEKTRKNKKEDKEKQGSSREKDKNERSKESKHDKTKSSPNDSSHRDKHHKSSTSHSSTSGSKPSTSAIERPSSSTAHTKADSGHSSRKRPHDSDSNDGSPTKAKVSKTPKSIKLKSKTNDNEEEVGADEGIDSSMGANFADVLGMLNMPTKKSKKLLNNSKSPTPSKIPLNEKPHSSSSNSNSKNEYRPSSMSSASTSAKPVDEKPELLSASAKLAPLDPSIVFELPTISTNYKPLPHNKTVMDCVYRNSGAVVNTPKPVRTLTDAEALSHSISSKTMRTKIYSGIKTGQVLQVPSLFDLCIRILQKNIDALEYTGGVPFEVLRPVLERATPPQLLTFEEYNPYMMEDSDCLWQIHVQRNYRTKKRMEMESWREMYLVCMQSIIIRAF